MSTLRASITELASHFAAGVLNAIKGASLEDILAETNRTGFSASAIAAASGSGGGGVKRGPGRPKGSGAKAVSAVAPAEGGKKRGRRGRLGRRSADDIGAIVEQIVSLLASSPKGLRAEEIRAQLGLEAKELPRPIADALAAKKISKQGEKRATTYFAKGGGGASAGKGGKAKKAAKGEAKASKGKAKKAGAASAKKGAKRGPKPGRKAAAAAASAEASTPAEAEAV